MHADKLEVPTLLARIPNVGPDGDMCAILRAIALVEIDLHTRQVFHADPVEASRGLRSVSMQSSYEDLNSPNGAIHGGHDLPDEAQAVLYHCEPGTFALVSAVRQTEIQIRPYEVVNDPATRLLLEDPLRMALVRQYLRHVLRQTLPIGFPP